VVVDIIVAHSETLGTTGFARLLSGYCMARVGENVRDAGLKTLASSHLTFPPAPALA